MKPCQESTTNTNASSLIVGIEESSALITLNLLTPSLILIHYLSIHYHPRVVDMASTPPADYGKEAVLDVTESRDVETGEVKNGGLQRDLKNRHMQMIAIGMTSFLLLHLLAHY